MEGWESKVWKIAEQYVLYKLDVDEGMFWLFDVEEGTCFDLNETSYFILSCFDGRKSMSEILKKVVSAYPDEDKEVVTKDFIELFEKLREHGVLEPVSNFSK